MDDHQGVRYVLYNPVQSVLKISYVQANGHDILTILGSHVESTQTVHAMGQTIGSIVQTVPQGREGRKSHTHVLPLVQLREFNRTTYSSRCRVITSPRRPEAHNPGVITDIGTLLHA